MVHDRTSIHTPAFVVKEAVALANIHAFQAHCDRVGLALRPHIKTHKSIRFARAQLAAGATGITCQKISEAEAMLGGQTGTGISGGGRIDDILITYNILGAAKLQRLRALSERVRALSVVADNSFVVQGLSAAFQNAPRPLTVLVECDTGAKRCGVQTPESAVELAGQIAGSPGLVFGGLMTYPPVAPRVAPSSPNPASLTGSTGPVVFLRETKRLLELAGLACPLVSSGGSPDMRAAAPDGIISEYRIGTYVYNDRSLVRHGVCGWDDCAGRVLATVVSTPAPGRAVIDAGSKALTSDLLGFSDYGHVCGHPKARITGLSEEHGVLETGPQTPLRVGGRIEIIPNHVCVVSNLFDEIWLEGTDGTLQPLPVDARGKVI